MRIKGNYFFKYDAYDPPLPFERAFYDRRKDDEFPHPLFQTCWTYFYRNDLRGILPAVEPPTCTFTHCWDLYENVFIDMLRRCGVRIVYSPHARDNTVDGIRFVPAPYPIDFENPGEYEKDILACFVGSARDTKGIRPRIREMFAGEDGFHIELNERFFYDVEDGPAREQMREDYSAIMKRSRYALCPEGAGVASIRIYEALAYGCIPIIISDDFVMPPSVDREYHQVGPGEMERIFEIVGRECPEPSPTVTGPAGERFRRLQEAAASGDPRAQFNLGLACEKGDGVAKNMYRAAGWYRRSAAAGCLPAQINYARCCASGSGTRRNRAEAVRWYQPAAERGDPRAQHNLGSCYARGDDGVEKDEAAAARWWRAAAEQGYPKAQRKTGICLHTGLGVARDWPAAVGWFRRAAEQGDAGAQYWLGLCLENGLGTDVDLAETARWWRVAADGGHAEAAFTLGILHKYGIGVSQDPPEAIRLWHRAAEGNYAPAFYNLGFSYRFGRGVARDEKKAARWFRAAAERRDFLARNHLEQLIPPRGKVPAPPAAGDGPFDRPIFVVGAQRSGTSLVAGSLAACGAWTGDAVAKPDAHNPRGYFENTYLRIKVVRQILINEGCDPLGVRKIPAPDRPVAVPGLREIVYKVVHVDGYDDNGPWLYKDPILTLFWPLFADAFPAARWVIVRRDEDQIVDSCLRTAFMNQHSDDPAFWRRFAGEYRRRLDGLAASGAAVCAVRSADLAAGRMDGFREVVERLGLAFREKELAAFIEPGIWGGG